MDLNESIIEDTFNKRRVLKTSPVYNNNGPSPIHGPGASTSVGHGEYVLPPTQQICKVDDESNWQIRELTTLKTKLNDTKNQLDNLVLNKWHIHTKDMNPAGNVMRTIRCKFHPEYCSQAWCKFYEMLNTFPMLIPKGVVENYVKFMQSTDQNGEEVQVTTTRRMQRSRRKHLLTSLHLCEAPGAFISALNHYLFTNYPDLPWNWIGTTLNPYYEGNQCLEMINDDVLIQSSLDKWTFLEDGTGNLINQSNVRGLIKEVQDKFGGDGQVQGDGFLKLVTADGSIDCQSAPDEQEKMVVQLHYAEIVTALAVLEKGGSFVLKIFTFLEAPTISHLYLLSCVFGEVHLIKPATSKEGNSEVYVICLDYLGINAELLEHLLIHIDKEQPEDISTKALFPIQAIPKRFVLKLSECADFFVNTQIRVINKNIATYAEKTSYHRFMRKVRNQLAEKWIQKCKIHAMKQHGRLFRNCWPNCINYHVDARDESDSTHLEQVRKEESRLVEPNLHLRLIENELQVFQDYLSAVAANGIVNPTTPPPATPSSQPMPSTSSTSTRKSYGHRGGSHSRARASLSPSPSPSASPTAASAITTAVVAVNLDNNPIELTCKFQLSSTNFCYSKPYVNVHSSRFCSAKLLSQRDQIRRKDFFTPQLLQKIVQEESKTACKFCSDKKDLELKLNTRFKKELHCRHSNQAEKYTAWHAMRPSGIVVIVQCYYESLVELMNFNDFELATSKLQILLNLLLSIEHGNSLFLCCFPLLTRIHLGILFCLVPHFEQVFITRHGIFLARFKGFADAGERGVGPESLDLCSSESEWLAVRNELALLASGTKNSTKILSEVLPIQQLCCTKFSNVIYTYNVARVVADIQQYIHVCRSVIGYPVSLPVPHASTSSSSALPLKRMNPGVNAASGSFGAQWNRNSFGGRRKRNGPSPSPAEKEKKPAANPSPSSP